jgi:hypothetical protein
MCWWCGVLIGTVAENIMNKMHHKYCSEIVGYLCILDLINAQNMEQIKILSQNLPGGTWETTKTTVNLQTVVVTHYSIILHEYLFPRCTTWSPPPTLELPTPSYNFRIILIWSTIWQRSGRCSIDTSLSVSPTVR